MDEAITPDEGGQKELRIGSLDEIVHLVQANDEIVRASLGVPTKAEVESSASMVPALMCDPFLTADDFFARTEGAQAIIVISFATGAMPDRLVPAIAQRIQEGIPVFVLSNNPGDSSGILRVTYDAGSGAYKAGAVGLQKVNINQHMLVKAAIVDALSRGLRGQELKQEIEQLYAYKKGEDVPVAEWDKLGYAGPPQKDIRDMLTDSGFMDNDGKYIPFK